MIALLKIEKTDNDRSCVVGFAGEEPERGNIVSSCGSRFQSPSLPGQGDAGAALTPAEYEALIDAVVQEIVTSGVFPTEVRSLLHGLVPPTIPPPVQTRVWGWVLTTVNPVTGVQTGEITHFWNPQLAAWIFAQPGTTLQIPRQVDEFFASAGVTSYPLATATNAIVWSDLYLNGIKQESADFSVSLTTLTWTGMALKTTDKIEVIRGFS